MTFGSWRDYAERPNSLDATHAIPRRVFGGVDPATFSTSAQALRHSTTQPAFVALNTFTKN